MIEIKAILTNGKYEIALNRLQDMFAYEATIDQVIDIMNNKSKPVAFKIMDYYTLIDMEVVKAIVKNSIKIDVKMGNRHKYMLCIASDKDDITINVEVLHGEFKAYSISEKEASEVVINEIKAINKEKSIEDLIDEINYDRKKYEREYSIYHTYMQVKDTSIKYIYKDNGILVQSAYW